MAERSPRAKPCSRAASQPRIASSDVGFFDSSLVAAARTNPRLSSISHCLAVLRGLKKTSAWHRSQSYQNRRRQIVKPYYGEFYQQHSP